MTSTHQRWLSVGEMARRFGVHAKTIRQWIYEDKLPKPIQLTERGHRFWSVAEIEQWEQSKLEARQ